MTTDDLPWTYIPGQLAARLPVMFLLLLMAAVLLAFWSGGLAVVQSTREVKRHGLSHLRLPLIALAGERGKIVVWMAAMMPIAFLILRHSTLYDGIRHILFVINAWAVGW